MGCNKEEAMRAKETAEKKMRSKDFEGARKDAMKAKNLYPELENLNQMLSICDVYCSAQIRILGLMKDWYGVLQVEKWADELTIKKQYRQLSLVLHPDKNQFPGAEGAFKLICEANAVLSNPAKRSLYDNKIKDLPKPASENHPNHQSNRDNFTNAVLSNPAKRSLYDNKIKDLPKPASENHPNHQSNRDNQFNQQHGAQNSNTSNGFSSQNQHQATQSSPVFLACSYCGTNYPYSRKHCTKCFTDFTANEMSDPRVSTAKMGHQGVSSKPEVRQPDVFEKKVGTDQVNSEIGVQNVKVPAMSRPGSPEPGTQKGGGSESINVENVAENLKTKETVNVNVSSSRGIKVGVPSDGDVVRRESKNTRTKSRNEMRKLELEARYGSDDIEVVTEQETLNFNASSLRCKKVAVTANGDAVRGESKNTRTKSRNEMRKLELESRYGSDIDIEVVTELETLNFNASSLRCKNVAVTAANGDAVRGESKNTRTQSWNKRRKLELEPSDGSYSDVEIMTEQETLDFIANSLRHKKVAVTSNGDAVHGKSKNIRTTSRNKRRKLELESSDGSDIDKEDVTEQENLGDADPKPEVVRRSSRRRHHVFYKEPDEDDFGRPLKRSHSTEDANGKEQIDGEDSEHIFPTVPDSSKSRNKSKESLKSKSDGCDKGEIGRVTSGRSSATADFVETETETDSDLDLSSGKSSDSLVLKCSDPEFSDFDKLREESQFHVNQLWACYDALDRMPRFYAKVRKVRSSPFELDITWLDAVAIDDSWEKWVDEGLPVGCGSFKLGKPDKVSGCLSLSHQVHCEKGQKKGYFSIYPREGEVWALYRDWDISWSSNVKEFRYEIVEVLSDFAAGVGIKVVYLDKITGFVSLFFQSETSSFIIKPSELYKFSHYVPSFKMTGDESLGVPIGSFELDPASLPINSDDLYVSSKAKIVSRDEDYGVPSPLPRYGEGKGKDVAVSRDEDSGFPSPLPSKDVASGSTSSPDKIVDMEGGSNEDASPNVNRLSKWVFRPGLLGSSYFSFGPIGVNFFRPNFFR